MDTRFDLDRFHKDLQTHKTMVQHFRDQVDSYIERLEMPGEEGAGTANIENGFTTPGVSNRVRKEACKRLQEFSGGLTSFMEPFIDIADCLDDIYMVSHNPHFWQSFVLIVLPQLSAEEHKELNDLLQDQYDALVLYAQDYWAYSTTMPINRDRVNFSPLL